MDDIHFIKSPSKSPISKLAMALILSLMLTLSWAIAASTYGNRLVQVPPSSIQVFQASDVALPRSVLAADNITTLAQIQKLPNQLVTQYHLYIQESQAPKAILILGTGGPARLYLNAIGVDSAIPQISPGPVQGGFWLNSELPSALLNPGENRLDLVVAPSLWRSGLADVRVGTSDQVESVAAGHQYLQERLHVLSLLAGLICLICTPFMLVIGRALGASFAAALIAGTLIANYFLGEGRLTSYPILAALSWSDVAMIVAAIGVLAPSNDANGLFGGIFKGLGVTLLISGLVSLLGWRLDIDFPFQLVLSQIAPLVIAGLGMPLMVGTGLKTLLDERASSRARALQQAILLSQQAAQIEKQAEFQAVIEERKRFTRDIHDGIGGQLVSLLWRVRSEHVPAEELASELESGIADLRLVADALDEGPVSLSVALWNFSARARQQLNAAQMNFSWSLPDELDVEWTDARRILSLYRMLQESVSNAVRHSNAKNLAIAFEETLVDGAAHVKVVIEDDGIGFDPSERIAGRGLTNLKSRAKQMGGTIAIAKPALGSGTRIEISLPAKQDEGQLPIMSVK